MTTLISVRCDGKVIGRCDARCYDAKEHDCDCICGGVNHTVGYEVALANTQALKAKEMDDAAIATWLALSGRQDLYMPEEIEVKVEVTGIAAISVPDLNVLGKKEG